MGFYKLSAFERLGLAQKTVLNAGSRYINFSLREA